MASSMRGGQASEDDSNYFSASSSSSPSRPHTSAAASPEPESESSEGHNIQVLCRFRPESAREIAQRRPEDAGSFVTFPSDGGGCDDAGGDSCEVSLEGRVAGRYTFDRVFAPGASQNDVFESIGRQTVEAVLDGFNAAVLSYGQTGSGKTHSMIGPGFDGRALGGAAAAAAAADVGVDFNLPSAGEQEAGLVPRIMQSLFAQIGALESEEVHYAVRCSYIEIYLENVRDLLNPLPETNRPGAGGPKAHSLTIRQDAHRGMLLPDATEVPLHAVADLFAVLRLGARHRKTAATKANETSSRSHAILLVSLTRRSTAHTRTSQLYLADLAGSEKVEKCWGKGTTFLMHDGSVKKVEDIQNGDVLLGDDGTPRVVSATVHGNTGIDAADWFARYDNGNDARMAPATYKISMHKKGLQEWTCNGAHILVLKWNQKPAIVEQGGQLVIQLPQIVTKQGVPLVSFQQLERTFPATESGRKDARAFRFEWMRENAWQPPVWDVSLNDFLTHYPASIQHCCAMFQAGAVQLAPLVDSVQQPRSLRARIAVAMMEKAQHDIVPPSDDILNDAFVEDSAWVLGMWLAKSRANAAAVGPVLDVNPLLCDALPPTKERLERWCSATPLRALGHRVENGNDVLHGLLQSYRLLDCKDVDQSIPTDLLRESAEVREALLDGLIDGGETPAVANADVGSRLNSSFAVVHSSKLFIDSVQLLARTLGHRADEISEVSAEGGKSCYQCAIVRNSSSGSCPIASDDGSVCTVADDGSDDAEVADPSCFGFTIERVAHADYFGFSLSGSNGRCLLSDLVVTHNTEVSGLNLQEANLINRGLLSLGQVIQALVKQGQTGKQVHIPYRNSRLTRLLSNSIGGNSRTFMLLSCSPSPFNLKETLSTLRFGDAMKRIKNRSIQNIELTHAELKALLAVNQQENEQLKQRVTWLENQLRRATGGAAAGDDADDDIQVGHLPVPVTPIPSATGRHSKSPSAASVTSASVVTAAAISSPPDDSRNGGTSSREDDDDREARRQERIARTQARFMQQRDAAENVELERWQREQQQQGLWTTTIEPPSPESAVSSSAASSFSSASPVSGTPRPSSAAPSLLSSPEPSSSSSSSSSLSLSPASTTSSSSSSSSSPRVLEFTSPALAAAIPTGSSPARHHSAVEQRKPLQDAELPSSLLIRPSRDRNSAADLRQLLSSFLCPLSKKVMSDPVVALDGVTYERRALLAYFAKYPSSSAAAPLVSPSTGQLLASKVVVPNVLLQRMIRQFYPEALARQRRMVQSRGILSVSAPDGEGGLDAPYLSVLPEAVLSYLAEWMDARTLCRLGQTSREMLEGVASDKRLWKLMLLRQRMHFSAADMAKADADAEGRRGGGVGGGGGGAKALYRARVLLHRPQHLQQRDKEIAEWKASGGSGTATGVYLAAPPIAAASAAAVVARMAAQGRPRTSGGATPRR